MKGLRILLVDDEPLMRLSMVDALEAVATRLQQPSAWTPMVLAHDQRLDVLKGYHPTGGGFAMAASDACQ